MERTVMKKLLTFIACLIGLTASAQYRPTYFDTNASPFGVVPGVSMYVPSLYSTNMVSTNLSVTDYLFIGTAQVNYLTMLGAINQQGLVYTNYFQAETNYFRGSLTASNITATGTSTANVFVADFNRLTDTTSSNIFVFKTNGVPMLWLEHTPALPHQIRFKTLGNIDQLVFNVDDPSGSHFTGDTASSTGAYALLDNEEGIPVMDAPDTGGIFAHTNINVSGNITATGTITGDGLQTTNMWLSIPAQAPFPATLQPIGMFGTLRMEATNLVATPVGGTYYNVANWGGYIAHGFTANTTLGFLTNSVAGYYRIMADISFIGANGELYEVCVLTNMVDSEFVSSKKQFTTPGRYDCIPVSGRMYLYPNTAVSLAVKSTTDTGQITVHRASLDVGN